MAKIIEFYVPIRFKKKATKWITPQRHAKVIPFKSKKEVGLTKTIMLLVNNGFVRSSARLEVVEGCVSELEQNGSTKQ